MEEATLPNKKRLIRELLRGRDASKKLQNLLRRKLFHDGSVSAADLVLNILGSFSDSLSVLRALSSDELCLDPAATYADSTKRVKKLAPVVKDRRGCYKRKKTADSRVKIVDTIEDGYAWRKYGQKDISSAKFPRCYFRCTHKNEGCKALKQVQKLEDGSEMFHIIYFGHHTCQNMYQNTYVFSHSEDLSVFLLKSEDSKINIPPTSTSTITNAHITPSLEQEDDSYAQSEYHLLSRNYGHGQPSTAFPKDIIGTNLEPFHEDGIKNDAYFKFDDDVFL